MQGGGEDSSVEFEESWAFVARAVICGADSGAPRLSFNIKKGPDLLHASWEKIPHQDCVADGRRLNIKVDEKMVPIG